ncbi:MAG: hypothetical protein ACOYX1_12090 [Acidobacteriota bacterium]
MTNKVRIGFVSALAPILFTVAAFAQMGGGMGSGMGPGMGSGMGSGLGSGGTQDPRQPGQFGNGVGPGMTGVNGMTGANGMMGAGMGNGMMNDLTVGPDGTVYVVRPVQLLAPLTPGNPSQQYAYQQELAAISPVDGTIRWKLQLTGGHVSQPVVGKDGKLFLAVRGGQVMAQGQQNGGMMNPGETDPPNYPRFLVISAAATSATIERTVEVDSDILGEPQVTSTGAGPSDYVIYVTGMEMPGGSATVTDTDSIPAGEKTLYAFQPDGTLKFKVKIGQTMVGVTPH